MTQTRVTEQADRFEIKADGVRAGLARFVDHGGRRILFHTEVDDAFEGQGLAERLVSEALDATRAAGLRVVPVCSYVARFIGRHGEYADLADPVTPETIRLVEQLPS